MSLWLRLHAHAASEALGRLARQPVASAVAVLVLGLAMFRLWCRERFAA